MVESVTRTTTTTATDNAKLTFDTDQFLNLLLLQLKNQDPTAAMDQSEFAAQLAMLFQVSAVQTVSDQVAASSNQMGLLTASALIGREVTFGVSGGSVTGTVDSVLVDKDKKIQLQVDGTDYSLDDLAGVS